MFSLDRQVSAAAAELCIIWLFAKYDINCFNMIVVMKEFEKKLIIYFTVSSFESPSIFVMSSPVSLLDDNFPLTLNGSCLFQKAQKDVFLHLNIQIGGKAA